MSMLYRFIDHLSFYYHKFTAHFFNLFNIKKKANYVKGKITSCQVNQV
jgi:hypothetical protein